jgi:DNA-binding NtrC family response regulator
VFGRLKMIFQVFKLYGILYVKDLDYRQIQVLGTNHLKKEDGGFKYFGIVRATSQRAARAFGEALQKRTKITPHRANAILYKKELQELEAQVTDLKKLYYEAVMKSNNGNISETARELGYNRKTVYRKFEEYKIVLEDEKKRREYA